MSLEVRNLQISLAGGQRVAQDISFRIKKGEMLAVVGSSGAGKTTLCKAVMGLLGAGYKTEGVIDYGGENLLTLPGKRLAQIYGKDICYIMQNPMTAFNPSLRMGRQLEKTFLQHHPQGSRAEVFPRAAPILRRLGIEDTKRVWKSYPFALSGGMLQRMMIVAALMNDPRLLIADEVTTAIDACNRMELMKELRLLCHEGMSVLFVTHDLRSAACSDRILIMNQGRTIESGPTEQIFNNPQEDYTKHLLLACQLERR
ncbi:ABC transporter related [Desulfitobacterium hafniense DCB-2]|uniref:ABC transporter related n=2 Tax=root TaxID=1 RepID=B8FSX2_DESHD|nr:ABC transporter ATP-binding protein [Desulfitobacterium hafniense]ACL21988.1 ABC transporter related [Desulfitobacterium hafniense DCB-2]MEA5022363.1 ABC transporter ATP-binding protein [Desulfitobacterium hafniense]